MGLGQSRPRSQKMGKDPGIVMAVIVVLNFLGRTFTLNLLAKIVALFQTKQMNLEIL